MHPIRVYCNTAHHDLPVTQDVQPLLVGFCAHHHSRYVHAVRRVLHKAHSLQYSLHALQTGRPLISCLTPAGCSQPRP